MTEVFGKLTQLFDQAVSRIRLTSVLNPCLWLVGVVTPVSLYLALKSSGPVQVAALVLACVPVGMFCIAYTYFSLTNPDKLRSEDYELRKMAMELIEEKGGRIPISGTSLEAIANPDYRSLPPPRPGEDQK